MVRALAALDEEGGHRVSPPPTLRALLAGPAPAGSRSRDPGAARLRLAGEVMYDAGAAVAVSATCVPKG
ncbi:hypothetical protein GCM10022403_022950 [Streptomyces coacervatus]|uniref:Uncharacterized protein n=1 Tax=Streptomyces coacervatus TaxID=647381 RepID=A0ABP7HB02_9ACTN